MGPRRSALTFLFYLSTCSLAAAQLPANLHRVHDWSTRHVLFSGLTPETVSAAIQSDPRALHSWLDHARHHFESPTQPQPELDDRREPADSDRSDDHRGRHHHRHHKKNSLATDWQMPLSLGVGPRSAPAKFGFNLNAVPDCTNDYAVFPTSNSNTPGSIGPNVNATLIAYNNLYTGPGPSGICPTPSAPALLPSVLFAYNTSTVSTGKADLSPVLSLDGTRIAFIESNDGGGNNYTAFHVLTWKAGEGTALGSPAVPGNCAPGNSCMTTLVLSSTRSDSRSEPFIDYALDVAYVGDDGGLLHKITPVFNGTPAEVIGGGWPVTLPGAGQVQSPVYDSVSGNVFVTSNAGGTLFVVNSSSGATSTVSTNALFPSEPIVDSASQTVFVFAVTSGFRLSVLQFNTSGTLLSQVTAGTIGGSANAYTGAFDNNYLTNPGSGSLYFAGVINFVATLYRVGFTGTTMNTAFSGPLVLVTGTLTSEPTPLTEIFNPSFSTAQDRLFVGIDANCTTVNNNGCIESVDISNGLPSAILNSHSLQTAGNSFSVSGIIVDNVSTLSQASSVYFESFTTSPPESAIKLTQADLQ